MTNYLHWLDMAACILAGSPVVAVCRDCGIRFLTSASNTNRNDLRCPFGCRQHHKRTESNRRSAAYYQFEEGRTKKKDHNARRAGRASPKIAIPPTAHEFSSEVVDYVRFIWSRIERRRIERDEVVQMLGRLLRQHSLDAAPAIGHFRASSSRAPPPRGERDN